MEHSPNPPSGAQATFPLAFTGILLAGAGLLAWAILHWGNEMAFLVLNHSSAPLADALLPHLTHLGDALILGGILGLWFGRRHPRALMDILLVLVLSGVLAQLGKNFLFSEWRRPPGIFPPEQYRYLEQALAKYRTFPSGHTTTAAAGFGYLAIQLRKFPLAGVVLALLALMVGYSRIYVGIHFPRDVLAGLLLGTGVAFGVMFLLSPKLPWHRWRKPRWYPALVSVLAAVAIALGIFSRYSNAFYN